MTKPKSIRFWILENGGWVRLKVPYGGRLAHVTGGPTEEGFNWEQTEWAHLPNNCIFCTVQTESRDCDGRMSDYAEYSSDMLKLDVVPIAVYYENTGDCIIMVPKWHNEGDKHRDHEAEKAGY